VLHRLDALASPARHLHALCPAEALEHHVDPFGEKPLNIHILRSREQPLVDRFDIRRGKAGTLNDTMTIANCNYKSGRDEPALPR
jgi:hypothetical protein